MLCCAVIICHAVSSDHFKNARSPCSFVVPSCVTAECVVSCRGVACGEQARVRREQKKLKDEMERLSESTAEHLRLARRRPSSTTSEEGDGRGSGGGPADAAAAVAAAQHSMMGLAPVGEGVTAAAAEAVAELEARVAAMEQAVSAFGSAGEVMGTLAATGEQMEQLREQVRATSSHTR